MFAGVERRHFDVLLSPSRTRRCAEKLLKIQSCNRCYWTFFQEYVKQYLVVLFEDLAEAGEVECLVVLNEDETEVELAECELDVVHFAHFRSLRFVVGVNVLEEVVATLSSIAQSGHLSIITFMVALNDT